MATREEQSEHRLATTSHDDYEANWNRQTDRLGDILTKKLKAHSTNHIEK